MSIGSKKLENLKNQTGMALQPTFNHFDVKSRTKDIHLGSWILRSIRRRIYRYRYHRNLLLEGPDILVDLASSSPEEVGPNRMARRPWSKEICRLVNRLEERDYRYFMVHRAYGYHGIEFPARSKDEYRHAYTIGRLEREWEEAVKKGVVNENGADGSTSDDIARDELLKIAKVFGTTLEFDNASTDEASEAVGF